MPPGFIALRTTGAETKKAERVASAHDRLVACVGAQVASQRCPILRTGVDSVTGHSDGSTLLQDQIRHWARLKISVTFRVEATRTGIIIVADQARLSERFALTLDDVAYFNILKCKTKENRTPSAALYQTCAQQTTRRQLEVLAPGFVLCFGKAVFDQVEAITAALRIPCNWILHPSGQHYRPPAQQERVKAVSAELSAIRQTR
jgi:N-acetylglutamate synthase-like GNAT family acetyltransferase